MTSEKKHSQPRQSPNWEAMEWLLKPLRLELEHQCPDTSVAGGVESWLPRLRKKLIEQAGGDPEAVDRLLLPLEQYAGASPALRRRKVEAVFAAFSACSRPDSKAALPSVAPRPVLADEPGRRYRLEDPVQYLKGVGPQRARVLKKLGITTAADLLYHFPRDWQDRRTVRPIGEVRAGDVATLCGAVRMRTTFTIRRGLTLTKVVLDDGTGRVEATWFNQPFMRDRFSDGQRVLIHGKVEYYRTWQMANPDYEILDNLAEDTIHTGRIVPLYPLTERLSQRVLRSIVFAAVSMLPESLPEILPAAVVQQHAFPPPARALHDIHFPSDDGPLAAARRRLIFEELFLQQVAVVRLKNRQALESTLALQTNGPRLTAFMQRLPFELTAAQTRTWGQIFLDLGKSRAMHRLLQGDVGSGKTIVAVLAMLAAVDTQQQAAFMAPTEVLAAQHYITLKQWLQPLGVRIELFTSGLRASDRRQRHERLADGDLDIAVGTHALAQEDLAFKALGLAVIDEQHRFGVQQRSQLRAKGRSPHVLVMTATPIPRTLAMTAYGDLDVSTIDEMPPGRMPITTVHVSRKAAAQAYTAVQRELEAKRQGYIIFPLIDESEKIELRALNTEFRRLAQDIFPGRRLGLLHGRLPTPEKEEVMSAFKSGAIDLLASTTVIEVGIDIPNATIMVIEDADRFGLAQLHQLRGRVGRGVHPAFCYAIADPKTEEGRMRLDVFTRIRDGFRLAEEDLMLRGPGEFFGLRQHGLPDLKLAHLIRDADQIELARAAAEEILTQDPELNEESHKDLKNIYLQVYSEREKRALSG